MIKHSIISYYLFLSISVLTARDIPIKFENITIKDGLAQSSVNCFLKDSKGFMWMGTIGGLSRFDGIQFKTFTTNPRNPYGINVNYVWKMIETVTDSSRYLWLATHGGGLNRFDIYQEMFTHYTYDPGDSNAISSDYLNAICVDDSGFIWLGTTGGLNRFDPRTEKFKHFHNNPDDPATLGSDYINNLLFDHCGRLWIGSLGGGVDCFDLRSGQFVHFLHDSNNSSSLSNNFVWVIYQDRSKNLWIGTQDGLNKIDAMQIESPELFTKSSQISFRHYSNYPGNQSGISGNWIMDMTEDMEGNLWIVTHGDGLNKLDQGTEKFTHYTYKYFDPTSICSDVLRSIYTDGESDIFWIGSESSGLSKFSLNQKPFYHFTHSPDNPASLGQETVFQFCEDKNGLVWIGLETAGVDCYDPKGNTFKHYPHIPGDPKTPPSGKVQAVYEDYSGNIWLGTAHGLARYDYKNDCFDSYPRDGSGKEFESSYWIQTICQLPDQDDGVLWLGTDKGLVWYNYVNNNYKRYYNIPSDPASLCNDYIQHLYPDRRDKNILWIATVGGVSRFDQSTEKMISFKHDPHDPKSLSNNSSYFIYRDRNNTLWIGTEAGLNRMNEGNNTFTYYTTDDGLPNSFIVAIAEDAEHRLWLSTLGGISCYDPDTEKFTNYDINDGLQGDEFWLLSAMRSRDGLFYFGGTNGFNVFHPDSIKINQRIPPIVFTDLELFNQVVSPGKDRPIKNSITESDRIELEYNEDIFTIRFAALDYNASSKNLYAYKMDGVDRDWVYTDASRRFATYTKLKSGNYFFQVKGSNNDGIWNEKGIRLNVRILPPWYRADLAYAIYIILGTMAAALLWRLRVQRIHQHYEREMEQLQTEKLKELDRAKSRFFTNISHEFRTPLTLIESPIKQFLDGELQGNIKEHCKIVLKNTRRLLSLVNQLLDLSRLESGQTRLSARRQKLNPLLSGLVQSFESLAVQKNISFTCEITNRELEIYLDTEKFEKIINNLLSNAFKYTPDAGTITVVVSSAYGDNGDNKDTVNISVSNSGPGIPESQIPKVFDRFYRVNESADGIGMGSGIGLALAKEYIELHGGTLAVESYPGIKTTFIVNLPLGCTHLSDDKISKQPLPTDTEKISLDNDTDYSDIIFKLNDSSIRSRNRILIIEDNIDVRKYIAQILQQDYFVIQAENGAVGRQKARDLGPDLIISDVMMPEIDGYKLCQLLKSELETSHIPVILLTARASQEEKYVGLEAGADDYVIKPFEAKELRLRVKNILIQKQRIREKLRREINIDFGNLELTSADKHFYERLMNLVNSDAYVNISIDNIAKDMALSRATLTRKIRGLFDQTPSDFFRTLQLKKAKKLLLSQFGTVSEVAFEVGFNSLSYFTKSYKKHFGITPSDETPAI